MRSRGRSPARRSSWRCWARRTYTYACATRTPQAEDWTRSIIAALENIGGTPRMLVPDQPRALISNPDGYEPMTHRLLAELGDRYGVAVLPARPAHPKDKAKVEVGGAGGGALDPDAPASPALRQRRDVNEAIEPLLAQLNAKPFQKLPGSRASAFAELDAPALQPLPAQNWEWASSRPFACTSTTTWRSMATATACHRRS